jgi:hypothetical protein
MPSILYKIRPKNSTDTPILNNKALKLAKTYNIGLLCDPEYQVLHNNCPGVLDELNGSTFTCAGLIRKINELAIELGFVREYSGMIDTPNITAAYALALRKLAAKNELCTVELVITLKIGSPLPKNMKPKGVPETVYIIHAKDPSVPVTFKPEAAECIDAGFKLCEPRYKLLAPEISSEELNGRTFSCFQLNAMIDVTAMDLKDIKDASEMVNPATTIALAGLALNRLAIENELCETELIITFKQHE